MLTLYANGTPINVVTSDESTITVGAEAKGRTVNIENMSFSQPLDITLENKSVLPYPYNRGNLTSGGVTFVDNGDGTITTSGTATTNIRFVLANSPENCHPDAGTYYFSGCPSGGGTSTYRIKIAAIKDGAEVKEWFDTGSGVLLELDGLDYDYLSVAMWVYKNCPTGFAFYAQLEKGFAKTDFTGYVTDFSGVSVTVTDGTNSQTAMADAEGKVFGLHSYAPYTLITSDNDSVVIAAGYQMSVKDYVNGLSSSNSVANDYVITVGKDGDCKTLNEALIKMSAVYPLYKRGGVLCEVRILSGTTIAEQIHVERMDLQYITITSEDDEVPVNCDGWGDATHDSREDYPFFKGENAARLPTIGCVFKLSVNTKNIPTVGYFANRGSAGVVLSDSGFDGFNDGVIANNESSVTIREGIARNMTRWGVHARHNGEVSARSCILTGCGIAAYADRVADLDIREAILDNSATGIVGNHTSRINANGTHMTNVGNGESAAIIQSTAGSIVNCNSITIVDPTSPVFSVSNGGIITACLASITNTNEVTLYTKTKNEITSHGIIMA